MANKLGLIGVGIHKHPPADHPECKYYARICINKKQIWLGYFPCKFKAAEAYDLAVDKYKPGSKKNNLSCIEDCENCYDKEEKLSDIHNVIITNEPNKSNRKIFILE
jgi:hypothetical protein